MRILMQRAQTWQQQRHVIRKNSSFFNLLFGFQNRVGQQKTQNYATETTVQLENTFKVHRLEECPKDTATVTKEEAAKYYYEMQTIRRMETAASALYRDKTIRGFCHLYSGQEAVAVGIKSAMRKQDNVITAYRCHAWSYLMGISSTGIMAELTGRKAGCSRGKGGSMHMYAPKYFGGNGIVGGQVPLGTGVALACQYSGDGGVCVTCYGDGAANQGQVFESYNIACLWKLPVIYVCENNRYAMGTKDSRGACDPSYFTRGDYVPGIWVDGMNLLAVRTAAQFAIEFAIKNGPIIIEADTYRYMGHSMSDPGTSYRKREEVQDVRKKRDPIVNFKELCTSQGVLTEEEIKAIDEKIRKEMDEVVAKSKSEPEIELKELTADIYAANFEKNIRGPTGFTLPHIQINKGANH